MIHVHIGQGKTGTTSLQAFLQANRGPLAQQGVTYPRNDTCTGGNATAAALAFCGRLPGYYREANPRLALAQPSFEGLWADLAGNHAANEVLLASSEELFVLPPAQFERRTHFDGQAKHIIVFLRRQDQLLESTWLQMAFAGVCVGTFDEFVADALDPGSPVHAQLRYDEVLEGWADAFGRANVSVLVYDGGQPDRNLVLRFLESIGVRATGAFVYPPRLNRAQHPLVADYLRQARGRNDACLRRRAGEVAAKLGLAGRKVSLLSASRRAEVRACFADCNARVARAFLPSAPATLFAAGDAAPLPAHFDFREHAADGARFAAMMDAADS